METYFIREIKQDLSVKENRLKLASALKNCGYGPKEALEFIKKNTIDMEVHSDLYHYIPSGFLVVERIDDYSHSGEWRC